MSTVQSDEYESLEPPEEFFEVDPRENELSAWKAKVFHLKSLLAASDRMLEDGVKNGSVKRDWLKGMRQRVSSAKDFVVC
jgi:hypothetical protein